MVLPGDLGAQRGRLQQRQAAVASAADVDRDAVPALGTVELLVEQLEQVLDVEQIADLLALRRRSRCTAAGGGSGGRASSR